MDFTFPAVADWWGTYQQKPIDDGISGFWTDMGEPAWSNEEQTERLVMKHHLGMHDEIHNVYGLTWDKVVKEQFEKRNPNRRVPLMRDCSVIRSVGREIAEMETMYCRAGGNWLIRFR